jgi:hypothetical protein
LILGASPTAVAALGDDQYDATDYATLDDYTKVFDPTWGRFKPLICPVPGNHEYPMGTTTSVFNATLGYFQYFNTANTLCPPGAIDHGWYSYDLGSWHVIALNSNCTSADGCLNFNHGQVPPEELAWLQNDLATHPGVCTIAYWHHPLFTDAVSPGPSPAVKPLWDALYAAGADVVLNGHEHLYERFHRLDPSGSQTPQGIREFVVGTGGDDLGQLGPNPTSASNDDGDFGALFLTLRDGAYDWSFRNTAGTEVDGGSTSCHPRTGVAPDVTRTTATLKGLFNPGGDSFKYRFEWGATSAYGQQTAWTALPTVDADQQLSAPLSGLVPGSTYHYRVEVSDAVSDPTHTQVGRDGSFATQADATAVSPSSPGAASGATPSSLAAQFPAILDLTVKPRRVGVGSAASNSTRGATVSYRLSDAAFVTFRLERAHRGVLRGGACVRPSGRHASRRCTRWRILAALTLREHAGFHRWRLFRLAGRTRLASGFYRVAAVPRDAGGHIGVPVTARFRVVA